MISTLFTTNELQQLIRTRSRVGAEVLFDKYAVILRLAIFRIVQQKDLTDIILQKTIHKIWDTIDLFKEQDLPMLAWMLAIAKTLAKEGLVIPVDAIGSDKPGIQTTYSFASPAGVGVAGSNNVKLAGQLVYGKSYAPQFYLQFKID